ncbi:MASE1 domain-containing protein [Luteibacter sp. CQ10]|uniref:MASE1 domain-containing protein n=1 Tax=Luteibacter sp. CQ10 TaxID=2805821 RepID=UPI0034A236D9
MRVERHPVPYGDHIAVVLAYAAAYQVLYPFMQSNWVITSGLRVSCLLLVPRRYWPALVLGEWIPIVEKTVTNAHKFGVMWAVTSSIPFILVCIPVIGALLRRMPLHGRDGYLSIDTLLKICLALSVVTAIEVNLASFPGYLTYPDPVKAWSENMVSFSLGMLLGNYLGTLTIVPMVIVLHEWISGRRRNLHWRSLLHEAILIVVPYLSIVIATAKTDSFEAVTFAQLAIALPVVSMTANHGRPGAALGAMLSSVAMHYVFSKELDPAMLRGEGMLAAVITVALIATRPFRPVRTFRAYPATKAYVDRASIFFKQGLARLPLRFRHPSQGR